MNRIAASVIVVAISAVSLGIFVVPRVVAGPTNDTERIPVLVELFTSQGCSSCPPADKVLRTLSEQPIDGVRIIPLSWHVDYWNGLGWTDPYSSETATARQQAYATDLNARGLYTPQMVVDGQSEFVGSDRPRAFDVIRAAAKSRKITLHITPQRINGGITVRAVTDSGAVSDDWNVLLVVTEDHVSTDVKRGENNGRTLQHTAVVRGSAPMTKVESGTWEGTLTDPNNAEDIAAVVIAHDSGGKIRAIAQVTL